jgi:chromosome segregation ATPase
MDQSANHILLRGGQPGAADRMRDLLARTVQDHVTDQRSHASALEEIRKHLEGLEWLVKEVRQHELAGLSGQLTAQTEGLLAQLTEAREYTPDWAEALEQPIRAISAQVKPVAELPALWADLGVMAENVDQVLPRVQAACDMLTQATSTLRAQEERLTALQQNDVRLQQSMETAAGRFSRLDKALAEMAQRAGYLDKEMSAVKGRIDQGFAAQAARFEQNVSVLSGTVEEGLAGAAAKVDGLAAGVSGLTGQVDLIGGQVQVAHGRLERLEDRLGDADDKIGTVDNKLGALDAKLTGTDGKVGALANRIDRLDDRIGDTDDRIGLINERMTSIDDRIGLIDGHISLVDERTAPLDSRLEGLDGRLEGLDGQIGANAEQIGCVDEHVTAVDHKLGALDGRMDGLDGRLDGLGGRIEGMTAKFDSVDGRMEAVGGHFAGIDGRIKALGDHLAAVSGRLEAVSQQLGQLPTSLGLEEAQQRLAEELRLRPGHSEVEEVVTKVVSAAQAEMTTRLDSLEETVLTLAEALLRPSRRLPDQRRDNGRG